MSDAPGGFLAADEPPACDIINAAGSSDAVLVCDHASNRIPRRLGSLGLDPDERAAHIAWDPGASVVAEQLADLLDAPLVRSGYSRLVIDCNRPLNSAESIASHSAGIAIPGNQGLDTRDRNARAEALFRPYHHAIARLLDRRAAAGRPSVLLSIHSFTPALNGIARPWHVGISYRQDARLAIDLLNALAADTDLCVGRNTPYAITDETDYTIPAHGERRGIAHALIEIRQDGLALAADATAWARRLHRCYVRIKPGAGI
ncbi:MAG: N-formylglutamate amidohydrolase [Rhodospirillales bacterium]|nr:N-formylglutamate amidohydrolase [Rhodospirillales bacterium]